MSAIDQALLQLGVGNLTNTAAAVALSSAIDAFGSANAGPLEQVVKDVVKSSLPGIFRDPNSGGIAVPGKGGEWESGHYADDMIAHQPKFKFLFKIKFEGFGAEHFYFYVQRCDKPKILFMHQEVNYYNFRTKVLTQTQFQPISVTFYDEIGNSVNKFFVEYMKLLSGQGSGNWGIDKGFGDASSTKPYQGNKGYSHGKRITIEQIFANGVLSNRFIFINPRIEQFDFDELNMEDNGFNTMTCNFHYDALQCETVQHQTIHTWGNTDLLRGGGTSGVPNAGASELGESGKVFAQSANGGGINGPSPMLYQPNLLQAAVNSGVSAINAIPGAIADMVNSASNLLPTSAKPVVTSSYDTLSRDIINTLSTIQSGSNLTFNNPSAYVNNAPTVNNPSAYLAPTRYAGLG